MKIAFELNGIKQEIDCLPDRRVVDLLREELGYTGTKEEEMILTMKRKMTPEQFDKWTRITKEIFPDIFE